MVYFYARVSSNDQNPARQLEVAKGYKDIDEVFCDKQSGKNFDREQYQRMKAVLKSGDEVIVKSLDRLSRNKTDIEKELQFFKDNGVRLKIIDLPTTMVDLPIGQEWVLEMVNNILIEVLGTIAEQERETIKQRQAEGIAAKRASDTWDEYGRPKKEIHGFEKFLQKQKDGELSVNECCQQLGISRSTWYSRVRETCF